MGYIWGEEGCWLFRVPVSTNRNNGMCLHTSETTHPTHPSQGALSCLAEILDLRLTIRQQGTSAVQCWRMPAVAARTCSVRLPPAGVNTSSQRGKRQPPDPLPDGRRKQPTYGVKRVYGQRSHAFLGIRLLACRLS